MQINRDIDTSHYTIQSYAEGEVTVVIPRRFDQPAAAPAGGTGTGDTRRKTFRRSLIVMPEKLITDWPPQRWEEQNWMSCPKTSRCRVKRRARPSKEFSQADHSRLVQAQWKLLSPSSTPRSETNVSPNSHPAI